MTPLPDDPNDDAAAVRLVDTTKSTLSEKESEYAIASLQRLIQYETVSATAADTGAYHECAQYLVQELSPLFGNDSVWFLPSSPRNAPVVVAHWKGLEEELPVLLLNSHYDVVPAETKDWSVPPFDGLRQDGKVYGRGTQDMKCVCVQYIEAIRKLKQLGYHQPRRSVYLTFVPDEEVGGSGMAALLDSTLYKETLSKVGIALALDEGLASIDNVFSVFYGERLPWWIDVTAKGNTGHGSRFIEHTAVEQLVELANRALAFRKGQRDLLGLDDHSNCAHAVAAAKKKMTLGDVTTLNITTLQAGVAVGNTFAYNCVPPVAKCSLDIRISPHTEPKQIKDMIDMWCQECATTDHGLSWEYIGEAGNDLQEHATTSTDAKINPWYNVFCQSMASMDLGVNPQVFPAATDSRFLRALGIRALGFSPMRNTEIMLHENDEYIPESTFLEGITTYVGLIHALSSQTREVDEMCA